jgi:hypothetical protein
MEAFFDITQVLNHYFDTLFYRDLEKFDTVFHQQAIYVTADESPPLFLHMNKYRNIIEQRESPASCKEVRKDVIESIKLAGKNTARVRAKCTIGSRDFVDFFNIDSR